MLHAFVLVFLVSCVVCLQSKQWSCIDLCLCCLLSFFCNKTMWFSGLHSCGLVSFLVVLCSIFVFFVFFHSLKKTPKKRTRQNPQKENAEKRDNKQFQLAQLCSQLVFLIFGGGIQNGINIFWKKKENVPKREKVESKICPSAAQHNWADIWLKKYFFLFFF